MNRIRVPAPVPPEAEGVVPEAELDDAAVITDLAAMAPMDYDRVRKEYARALGIQVRVLDEQVKAARNRDAGADRMPFVDTEPCDGPVDPAELFDEIVGIIRRYIVLEPEQADAAALWVAHTHMTELFEVSPLALINAPEKACAKTQFQTLLGRMSYRPLPASNASLSALFRAVEHWQPTILIDEADTFFRDNAELHGMVNAGYKRGGFVLRSEAVGDNFEPRMFNVYGAKSIAGIALERHLPDSTMSRGILFNMRRKLPHEKVERMRDADPAMFDRIRARLARFALDYARQIRLAQPKLPDELSDRAMDNWEPLLAIAACAGSAWVERATAAALKLSRASESQMSTGNELLADISDFFKKRTGDKVSTVELLAALVADDERPWSTYNRGKPMTPRQLAKHLSFYGIKSKTVRLGERNTPKGYERSQFEDAFARYLQQAEKRPPQRDDSPGPTGDRNRPPPVQEQEFFSIDSVRPSPPSSGSAGDGDEDPPTIDL